MNIPCNMTPTASPGRNEGIPRRMIGDLIEEIECQQEAIKQTSRVIWDKLYGDDSVKSPQKEGQVHIPSYRDRIDNVLEVNRSIMECLESILNGL